MFSVRAFGRRVLIGSMSAYSRTLWIENVTKGSGNGPRLLEEEMPFADTLGPQVIHAAVNMTEAHIVALDESTNAVPSPV